MCFSKTPLGNPEVSEFSSRLLRHVVLSAADEFFYHGVISTQGGGVDGIGANKDAIVLLMLTFNCSTFRSWLSGVTRTSDTGRMGAHGVFGLYRQLASHCVCTMALGFRCWSGVVMCVPFYFLIS